MKAGRAHLVLTLLDDWFGARSKQRRRRPPRHLLVRLRILTEKENPSSGSDPRQGSRGGFGVATRRPAAAGVGRPRFSGNPSPGEGVAGSAAMPWESTKVDPPSSRALFIVVLSLSACQVFSLGVDFWWRSESHPSFELFSPWEIIAILSFFSWVEPQKLCSFLRPNPYRGLAEFPLLLLTPFPLTQISRPFFFSISVLRLFAVLTGWGWNLRVGILAYSEILTLFCLLWIIFSQDYQEIWQERERSSF